MKRFRSALSALSAVCLLTATSCSRKVVIFVHKDKAVPVWQYGGKLKWIGANGTQEFVVYVPTGSCREGTTPASLPDGVTNVDVLVPGHMVTCTLTKQWKDRDLNYEIGFLPEDYKQVEGAPVPNVTIDVSSSIHVGSCKPC